MDLDKLHQLRVAAKEAARDSHYASGEYGYDHSIAQTTYNAALKAIDELATGAADVIEGTIND